MESHALDDLQATLQRSGPDAAIDRLITDLKSRRDAHGVFYALLMKKRHALGVSPVPTGSNQDLPANVHAAFEEGIREAARTAGQLCLDENNIPQAWAYFRMLGEPAPVAAALAKLEPSDDQDIQPLVEIALHHGVLPEKGYEWVLRRYGICNAITMLSGDLPLSPEGRAACIRRLVRALHQELVERLRSEISRQEAEKVSGPFSAAETGPDTFSVRNLIAGRDWLFNDDFYHIDLSHLSSVVQMSMHLEPSTELGMARELCEYGQHLSGRFVNPGDPPFEDQYRAIGLYLGILAGDRVEEGLDYFRKQAEQADPETVGTYPAQVLVNLLLKLGRAPEALTVARKYLASADNRQMSCPSIVELCQKVGDFRTLAEVAREQGDPVHFLAGLLAARTV